MGCNLPNPIQSPSNPTAPSLELWKSIITSLRTARPGFVAESLPGVFGVPAGAIVPAKALEHYEWIIAQADGLALERTNKLLLERDFTPEVRGLGEQGDEGVRLLLLHGDSDSGMPYEASAGVVKELVPRAQVKIYEKGGHGLNVTHAEQLLRDILDFVKSTRAG
jgi:pimeloyl-ACP methyl ester carboxylesterase